MILITINITERLVCKIQMDIVRFARMDTTLTELIVWFVQIVNIQVFVMRKEDVNVLKIGMDRFAKIVQTISLVRVVVNVLIVEFTEFVMKR